MASEVPSLRGGGQAYRYLKDTELWGEVEDFQTLCRKGGRG